MLMLTAAALNNAKTAPGPVIMQLKPSRVAEQNPTADVLDPQAWRTTGLL